MAAADSHSAPQQSLHVPGTSSLTGSKSASATVRRDLDSRLSDLLGSGDNWDDEDSAEKDGTKGVGRAADSGSDTTQVKPTSTTQNTKTRYTYAYTHILLLCYYIFTVIFFIYSEVKSNESGATPVSVLMSIISVDIHI